MRWIAAVGLASACGAAPPRPAPPPALRAPLDSLAFYVGTWSCRGTTFAAEGQPEEHWTARVEVQPELDGRWLSVQMSGPDRSRTAEHKGYDPATKTWHHVAVTNDGSWATLTSAGWDGATMVFVPDDRSDPTRTTFTKLGERAYSHAVTRPTEHGDVKIWEKVCTKA